MWVRVELKGPQKVTPAFLVKAVQAATMQGGEGICPQVALQEGPRVLQEFSTGHGDGDLTGCQERTEHILT